MTTVLVCIPTLTGREAYLENCLRGYRERTPEAKVILSVVRDAPSCGVGWNRATEIYRDWDYVHFSNDDVVVGEGWLEPLVEQCEAGDVVGPRIEPAGVHVGEFPLYEPPMAPGGRPAPTSKYGYFYADLPENQRRSAGAPIDHSGLPFCSRKQWETIGLFIPIHFGSDKWLSNRAWEEGFGVVAAPESVIYNYAPQIGRARGDWSERDFIDFDLNIAYPLYLTGELTLDQVHPLRGTPEGLELARSWRRVNVL